MTGRIDDPLRAARQWRRAATGALLALACSLCSCLSKPLPPPVPLSPDSETLSAMAQAPVVFIGMSTASGKIAPRGSAIVLDDRRLALTLHQVEQPTGVIQFTEDFGTRYTQVAGGATTFADIHRSGLSREDWALIELQDPLPLPYQPAAVDWGRPVAPGEPVYLIGYPFGDALRQEGDAVRVYVTELRRIMLAGRVEPRPPHRKAPDDVLYVRLPRPEDMGAGFSGGAAAVWDLDLRQPVIIGICSGSLVLERGGDRAAFAIIIRPTSPDAHR